MRLAPDTRLRVMHVLYSFDVGGLENGVVNLINRLPAERFRHIVVALSTCNPAFCQRVERGDVEFIALDKSPGHGVKLYPRLYRLFRQQRPTIVHTRNLAALETQVPAWLARVPVRIHGEHGWDSSDPHGLSRKYQRLRRLYSPFVQRYIALSAETERYLTDRVGIAGERIERICNGVDSVRFQPPPGRTLLAECPFADAEHILIGSVGRLQTVKDQLTLVRAFALARQQAEVGPRLRLLLAGDGPQRAEVEAEIGRHQIGEYCWLAGARSDVPAVLHSLDIFALPSRTEGISNTILEAMACGLPVVATAVGGNAELVVAGTTGSLVPAQDPAAMAAALLRYAADPALRQAHGRAGRARIEAEFSLEVMVGRYAAVYDSLLAQHPHLISSAQQGFSS